MFVATVRRKPVAESVPISAPPADQNEGANEGANEGVSRLLKLIRQQPGMRSPAIAGALGTSVKNIERWLKQLKDSQLIEFRGAPKTGGYYPKES